MDDQPNTFIRCVDTNLFLVNKFHSALIRIVNSHMLSLHRETARRFSPYFIGTRPIGGHQLVNFLAAIAVNDDTLGIMALTRY